MGYYGTTRFHESLDGSSAQHPPKSERQRLLEEELRQEQLRVTSHLGEEEAAHYRRVGELNAGAIDKTVEGIKSGVQMAREGARAQQAVAREEREGKKFSQDMLMGEEQLAGAKTKREADELAYKQAQEEETWMGAQNPDGTTRRTTVMQQKYIDQPKLDQDFKHSQIATNAATQAQIAANTGQISRQNKREDNFELAQAVKAGYMPIPKEEGGLVSSPRAQNEALKEKHNLNDVELAAITSGNVGLKAGQSNLPPEQKGTVDALIASNAKKTSIRNQIMAYRNEFNSAGSEDDKIRIGNQMIKVLNSTEGQDAVGAEEAKRLSDSLNYQIANLTGPGPVVGRDLPGFSRQVDATISAVDQGIKFNENEIDKLHGRPSRHKIENVPNQAPKERGGTAQAAPGGASNMVRMQAPDGSIMSVPKTSVQKYQQKGARIAE